MNRIGSLAVALILLPAGAAFGQQSGQWVIQGGEQRQDHPQSAQALTNGSIVKLAKAGLSDDTILAIVTNRPGNYSLGADDIVALKQASISDKVINAMLTKPASRVIGGTPEAAGAPLVAVRQVAPSDPLKLEDGTPVKIRLQRTLSSADAQVDDQIDFDVLDEVKVGALIVVPKGSIAWGTITAAQSKRRMGRGGKLDLNIDAVRLVDGEKAALRGVKDVKGGGHTGAMTGAIVATSLILWPAAPFFLFMHGKDITIPKGTELTVYINGDVSINAAKFAAASER